MRTLDYRSKRADTRWKSVYMFLRVVWAFVPLMLLITVSWFTFWLVDGIGRQQLSFKGYEFFINTIAVDILVHTIAITVIVMNFLFPKKRVDIREPLEDDFEIPR